MVELADPHKNLLGRIQENLVRIYETELPVIEDEDTRGEFFALVHSRLGK